MDFKLSLHKRGLDSVFRDASHTILNLSHLVLQSSRQGEKGKTSSVILPITMDSVNSFPSIYTAFVEERKTPSVFL